MRGLTLRVAAIILVMATTTACPRHGNNVSADAAYNASDESPDKGNNIAADAVDNSDMSSEPNKGNNVVAVNNASNAADNGTTPQ